MKHRSRHHGNSLAEYRRLQREIRSLFDPFTARHCPTCTAPCCVRPTRVTPFDVALALGTGHVFPHLEGADPYAPALSHAGYRLALPMAQEELQPIAWCEYLHQGRCTFPNDLRPFGCTTYLCSPMYAHLPEDTIRRLRRLIRQLEEVHVSVLRAMKETGKEPV
jgi:hypothetical protein